MSVLAVEAADAVGYWDDGLGVLSDNFLILNVSDLDATLGIAARGLVAV